MTERTTERPKPESKDLSKLIEQSVVSLQEMDRRLQGLRNDLVTLFGRTSALSTPPGAYGPVGGPGAGDFGGGTRMGGGALLTPFGAPAFAGAGYPSLSTPYAAGTGVGMGSLGITGPGAFGVGPSGTPTSSRDLSLTPPVSRTPDVDIVDDGTNFVLYLDLAGVRKEDLDITVSERLLTITAEARREMDDGSVVLAERAHTVYKRNIALPADVHTSQCQANLKDGVLTLRLTKKVPSEGPKRLDVMYG